MGEVNSGRERLPLGGSGGRITFRDPQRHKTGFHPSWSSLCRLSFFLVQVYAPRRHVPIFYGTLRPAGGQTVWLLHFMLQLTTLSYSI